MSDIDPILTPRVLHLFEDRPAFDVAGGALQHTTLWRAVEGGVLRGYGPQPIAGVRNVGLQPILDIGSRQAPSTAPYHYIVETDVLPDFEAEFNAWYDTEHLPGLSRVEGCLRASRFKRLDDSPRYLACYDLVSPEVMASAAWLAVRGTPWSDRIRPQFRNTTRALFTPWKL